MLNYKGIDRSLVAVEEKLVHYSDYDLKNPFSYINYAYSGEWDFMPLDTSTICQEIECKHWQLVTSSTMSIASELSLYADRMAEKAVFIR